MLDNFNSVMNNNVVIQIISITLTHSNFFVVKLFLLVLLAFFLKLSFKFFIKRLHPKIHSSFDVLKIHNHLINELYVILYIIPFIILLFLFRLSRIGKELDLKPVCKVFYQLFIEQQYLILIIIILSLAIIGILFLILIKTIKNHLELELLKRHLVLFARSNQYKQRVVWSKINLGYFFRPLEGYFVRESNCDTQGTYFIFMRIIFMFLHKKDIINYVLTPITFFKILFTELNYTQQARALTKLRSYAYKFLFWVLQLLPFSTINLILTVYDIYYNDFVLVKIFNFLPIYFIYLIWYKLTSIASDAVCANSLYEIIYDLYYKEHEVKYLFLTPEYAKIITLFVYHNLKFDNQTFECDVSSTSNMILYQCKYILVDENNQIYENYYTKRKFNLHTKENRDRYYEVF